MSLTVRNLSTYLYREFLPPLLSLILPFLLACTWHNSIHHLIRHNTMQQSVHKHKATTCTLALTSHETTVYILYTNTHLKQQCVHISERHVQEVTAYDQQRSGYHSTAVYVLGFTIHYFIIVYQVWKVYRTQPSKFSPKKDFINPYFPEPMTG